MANKKEKNDCILIQTSDGDCHNNSIECNPTEMIIIDSARKLMALGLTPNDIEQMDIKKSVSNVFSEYAKFDSKYDENKNQEEYSIGITIDRINEQLAGLSLELKMLGLRKRALKRRIKTLQKLASSFHSDLQ
ncbi:MAG: hypothetical protein SNJ70_09895 [Armatimonadota bacterium]